MPRTLACAALALASFTPALARADDVHGTRSDKLLEKAHVIDIRMGRGHADLVVRRTVHNGGQRHDQAEFWIDLPSAAVATGLRTLGMLAGKPHWFEGDLMEAEAAAKKYQELTGVGGYYPKDPALLSWRSQGLLALQVFPCAPGEDKTVEYTLRMPTSYRDGRYHLDLPAMGTEALPAAATVTSLVPGATLSANDEPLAAGGHLALKSEKDIAIAIPKAAPFDAALAAVPFGKGKNLVHFRFDAGAQISTVPSGAAVVLLIDASRSLSMDLGVQAAMARAYLSHFKDARVEVITFDRKATLHHGKFVSVGQAMAELRQLSFERKNGSNIDEALARADALLAALPPSTPRRILALTDARTRAELTPEVLRGKLQKSGALLHVGVVDEGQTELTRDDDHPWAKVTRPTGGLVWHAGINTSDPDEDKRRVYEEWARPVRIDKFAVRAQGVDQADLPRFEATLPEGHGIEDLRISEKPVPYFEVTGELWATPMHKTTVPDQAEGKLWAALFFGSLLLYEIPEEEMMPLAMLGRAVSPVTSYLAIEPGVRPSTEGLENEELHGVGSGWGFGSSHCGINVGRPTMGIDKMAFLRDALAQGLAACGGEGRHATVRLETTVAEVVSVRATIDGATSADDKLRGCLEEATWALALPNAFRAEWEETSVSL